MATERLQVVVDVDGAGKGSAEIRKLRSEISSTGKTARTASGGVDRLAASTRSADRASMAAGGQMGKTRGTITALGTAAKVTGGIIAVEFVRQGLGLMISEGREAQRMGRQTEAVIKSTGGTAKVSAGHVAALADETSRLAGIDDELIQQSANVMLSFKDIRNEGRGMNAIFDRSVRAAADLSALFSKDLNSSTIMVGKALNDPVKGLNAMSRAGVQFTEKQREQIKTLVESGEKLKAQKVILKELESQVQGQAAAKADPFDKLKVSINNLFESVGLKLLPVLGKGATAITNFLNGANKGQGAFEKIKRSIDEFVRSLGLSKRDIKQFGDAMANVWKAIKWITDKTWPGIKDRIKGQLGIIGGIVKVFAGILTGDFGKAWQGVKDIFSGGIKSAWGALKAATGPLRAAARAAFNAIKGPVSSVWKSIKLTVGGFINDIIGLINKIPGVNIGKINLGSGRGNAGTGEAYNNSPSTGGGRARGGFVGRGFARGGLTQIGRAGDRGHDTIPMNIGGQNVMVGSGEVAAVFNRHQQAALNARLADQGGLSGFFQRNKRPHYAAGGGIFGTGIHLPKPPQGEIVGDIGSWVIKQVKKYIKSKFGAGGGPSGLGSFDGIQVAKWIIPALKYARHNGWSGHITSGYRSHAHNVAQGRNYYSNHEGVQYPGGAVDVGGWGARAEGAALNAGLAGYGGRRLVWGGPTIGDWGHFSANGHARGGFVRGKVSWFNDSKTASGISAAVHRGLAINLKPGTDSGWNNNTTRGWMKKSPPITVNLRGRKFTTKAIDLGPAGWTNRALDFSVPLIRAMGWNTGNFPTDAVGTASWGSATGKSKGSSKAKQRSKAVRLTVQQLRDDRLAGFESALAAAEADDDETNPASYQDNIAILNQRIAYIKKITKKLLKERARINKRLEKIATTLKGKVSGATRSRLTSERTKLTLRRTKINQDLASYRGIIQSDTDSIKGMQTVASPSTESGGSSGLAQEIRDLLLRASGISDVQRDVFSSFVNNYVGSFDKGGPITRTGLATVHKDEWVVPRGGALVKNSAPPNIVVNVSGQNVSGDIRVDGQMVRQFNQQMGRESRRIDISPGRA